MGPKSKAEKDAARAEKKAARADKKAAKTDKLESKLDDLSLEDDGGRVATGNLISEPRARGKISFSFLFFFCY